MRSEGRIVAKFARGAIYTGWLRMGEVLHPDLYKRCITARLMDSKGKPVQGLPPLYDAVLVRANPSRWLLMGFERSLDVVCERDYHQVWEMHPTSTMDQPPTP